MTTAASAYNKRKAPQQYTAGWLDVEHANIQRAIQQYAIVDQVFNVLYQNADRTGATESSASIQRTLDMAYDAGGGIVRVPIGKYLVTSGLHMYQSVQLIGDGGGKEDHTGGGGGGVTGTQFIFNPAGADTFLTIERDPSGINPSAVTNAVCSGFGVRNTGPSGSDGIYFKDATFICHDVWMQGFAGGKAFRVLNAINSVFDQCMAFFGGWGLYMDPAGLSTTLALRGMYCASNTVNYKIQNVLGFNADDQTISESPVTDGWQIDNATRATLARVYNENIPGYVVRVGSQNSGVTTDLVIDEFNFQDGAANDVTKDMVYLEHADGVVFRLRNPSPERASIVRASSTVANLKVAVPWGNAYSNQRPTPGSGRSDATAYTKGDLFTAVCDDAVTRTFIVAVAGTTAGSQPAGYALGTLNLADGTASVSRYTTSTEWPVIDESLQLTSGWGDEQVRRAIGAGSVYTSDGHLEFSVSGWGAGVSATVDARDFPGGRISITCGGAPSANPTVTLTFKDGTFTNPPAVNQSRGDIALPDAAEWRCTTLDTTGATWTFLGTPVNGNVYVLDWLVVGK